MSGAVAAVDVGTSSVKALVVDLRGRVLGRGTAGFPTRRPGAGQVEQQPADWWAAAAAALAECGPALAGVRVLAVTGQMQDLLCVGPGGVLRPAILYSDSRAGAEHDEIGAELGDEWARSIHNEPDATSLPGKLRHLDRHEPHTLAATTSLLFGAGGYLCWRATGVAACDLTTASTTGLLDAARRDWWPPVVDLLKIGDRLPRLVTGDAVVGELLPGPAAELGLTAGIPVLLAAGDAAATTAGLVGDEPGAAYAYLGTSGWLAAVTGAAGRSPAAHRLLLPRPGHALVVGAVLSAGAAADWARRTLLPGASWAEADELARTGGPSGLLALPSLGGERYPLRDPHARGTFIGLTPASTAPQMYRAVLEGVAFALASMLSTVPATAGPLPVCGGGTRSALWLQLLADVTGRPVRPLPEPDADIAAGYGAARAALRTLTGHPPPPLAGQPDGPAVEPGPAAAGYAALRPAYESLCAALPEVFGALHRATRLTPP